ncbi:hypothetical protein [Pseudomonas sp. UBA3153]|uniref:hypothetical protein n=1 Tax=Pseudomonas sp. UBA3153 TaxID=1947313 RepID=UPI0039C9FADF
MDSGVGRNFLIIFSNPCYNLESGNRIGYSTTGGSLTRLDKIVAIDNGMPQGLPDRRHLPAGKGRWGGAGEGPGRVRRSALPR